MSKPEERGFPMGTAQTVSGLKLQLARLKEDLGRFLGRKSDGTVIASLNERIHEIETLIADANRRKKQDEQSSRNASNDAAEASGEIHSTAGHFPSRRR
ncbi:MAG: hypothetical protein HY985_14295 [Magnetospirillum sp.]|nr:hypothetical protein [Magnetospirillum sp.]